MGPIKATHPRQFRSNNLDVGNSWEQNVNFSSVSKHVRTTCKCPVGISNNYKSHFATHNTKSILPLMNDTTLPSADVPLTAIHRFCDPLMVQRRPVNRNVRHLPGNRGCHPKTQYELELTVRFWLDQTTCKFRN